MAYTQSRIPFGVRDYDEHDVINYYSFDAASGDAGSLVKVAAGNMSDDPISLISRTTANGGWANSYAHVSSKYPENPLKVTLAGATDTGRVLGMLLRDIRETDENGEKLLFYPQKKEELQCVVSGETVPVVTRGHFTVFVPRAVAGGVVPNVGDFALPAANGQITGVASATATPAQRELRIGKFIATGYRESGQDTDELAGAYALLVLSIN